MRNRYLITFKKMQKEPPEMFYEKAVLLKTSQYSQDGQKNTCVESLFNSEYGEIFKSSCFEEYLRTAASENAFMKLRKIKKYSKGVLTLH